MRDLVWISLLLLACLAGCSRVRASTVVINDDNSAVTYSGDWVYAGGVTGRDLLDDDIHYCSADGSYFDLTFNGPSLTIITETCSSYGAFYLYIDGNFLGLISEHITSPRVGGTTIFVSGDLGSGGHVAHCIKANGTYLVVDYFLVSSDPPPPPPPPPADLIAEIHSFRVAFDAEVLTHNFLLQCCAFALSWVAGAYCWGLTLRSKNERDFF